MEPIRGGLLKSFSVVDGASMVLDTDGTINIGRNNIDPYIGQEILLNFNTVGGLISGDGMIYLVGTPMGGRMVADTIFKPTSLSAQNFVRSLINHVPALTFATVFWDKDNNQWLINKGIDLYRTDLYNLSQTVIKLYPDDDIRSDDALTGYVYGYNSDVLFAIQPDGTRI